MEQIIYFGLFHMSLCIFFLIYALLDGSNVKSYKLITREQKCKMIYQYAQVIRDMADWDKDLKLDNWRTTAVK